jgi:dihydroorotate dehydrogenase
METLTDANKEVCLEINIEKIKYKFLSHHQNAGQIHDIKTVNISFANVPQLKYLGTTVTNQNLIHEEIKSRMNSGNICYNLI